MEVKNYSVSNFVTYVSMNCIADVESGGSLDGSYA